MKYLYLPSHADRSNPQVVNGRPLVKGAVVDIIAVNPTTSSAKVRDSRGNVQIVWLAALVPAEGLVKPREVKPR